MNERILNINDTVVTIKYGDIFEQQGLKVINFNEYFDTIVDDTIISRNTLNGIFIEQYIDDVNALDKEIEKQIEDNGFHIQTIERQCGKKVQCNLGSIIKYNKFLLLAFSRFDEKNEANLTTNEYFGCLKNFWKEINRIYAGYTVSVPLLGSGMTRIGVTSKRPTKQDLLQNIITTYSDSGIKLINGLNIVLSDNNKYEIDLNKIVI